MKYMVNEKFGYIDIILKNGLFRKTPEGECIFKSNQGLIDRFIRKNDMTEDEYNKEFNKFCEKYNIDWKKVLKLLK